MKPNYEEMVEKVVRVLELNISKEDKDNIVIFLNNTNNIVKILNDGKEDVELRSTQIIAYIINWYLTELYLGKKIEFN